MAHGIYKSFEDFDSYFELTTSNTLYTPFPTPFSGNIFGNNTTLLPSEPELLRDSNFDYSSTIPETVPNPFATWAVSSLNLLNRPKYNL